MNVKNIKKFKILFAITFLARLIHANDPTRADGPDMESPHNPMFKHSQNIFPNDNPAIIYFQASDNSLNNGIYNKRTQKATTDQHSYNKVVLINGTKKAPQLTTQNQYKDQKGNLLESIGIFNAYNENDGQSQIYYLFGKLTGKINNPGKINIIQNNAQPLIDFNSFSAENDGYPGIN